MLPGPTRPHLFSYPLGYSATSLKACVSTGDLSREARFEAERSEIPIRLVDLDKLALLILRHYEQFDGEGRAY